MWFARGYSWSGINSFLLSFGSRLLFGFTFCENSRNSSKEWRQPLVTLISFEFLSSTTKLHNLRERYVILSVPNEARSDSKHCKVAMQVDIMHMWRGWLDRFWNEPHIFFCCSWAWIVDWTDEVYGSSEHHSWATVSWVLSSSSITSYSQFDPQSLPLSLQSFQLCPWASNIPSLFSTGLR